MSVKCTVHSTTPGVSLAHSSRATSQKKPGEPCVCMSLTWIIVCVCVCVDRVLCCLQCVNAGMDTLTLARYLCEMSLMEMDFVAERGSLLASACLLMALVTKDLGGWVS